jgi:hypothetical protein
MEGNGESVLDHSFTTEQSVDEILRDKTTTEDEKNRTPWPRGTGFSQLPSAVITTVDHPLGSPSLLRRPSTPSNNKKRPLSKNRWQSMYDRYNDESKDQPISAHAISPTDFGSWERAPSARELRASRMPGAGASMPTFDNPGEHSDLLR